MNRALAVFSMLMLAVGCGSRPTEPTGLELGTLTVTTLTSGSGPDQDGYTITIATRGSRSLLPNGVSSYEGLEPGVYWLRLWGIAENCTVVGDNPRSVTVTKAATTRTEFAVVCSTTGTVIVRVSSTGDGLDPDGYLVTLEDRNKLVLGEQPVSGSGAVSFGLLLPDEYQVRLSGLSINCYPASDSVRSVVAFPGKPIEVQFQVGCLRSPPEALVVVVDVTCFDLFCSCFDFLSVCPTSGPGPLVADLYLDDQFLRSISGTVILSPVQAGTHVVRVDSHQCWVSGRSGRDFATVMVPAGGVGYTRFDAGC